MKNVQLALFIVFSTFFCRSHGSPVPIASLDRRLIPLDQLSALRSNAIAKAHQVQSLRPSKLTVRSDWDVDNIDFSEDDQRTLSSLSEDQKEELINYIVDSLPDDIPIPSLRKRVVPQGLKNIGAEVIGKMQQIATGAYELGVKFVSRSTDDLVAKMSASADDVMNQAGSKADDVGEGVAGAQAAAADNALPPEYQKVAKRLAKVVGGEVAERMLRKIETRALMRLYSRISDGPFFDYTGKFFGTMNRTPVNVAPAAGQGVVLQSKAADEEQKAAEKEGYLEASGYGGGLASKKYSAGGRPNGRLILSSTEEEYFRRRLSTLGSFESIRERRFLLEGIADATGYMDVTQAMELMLSTPLLPTEKQYLLRIIKGELRDTTANSRDKLSLINAVYQEASQW